MLSGSNAWTDRFILPNRNPLHITIWLFVVCALIYSIIVIGGFTRLTESGLSIVSWKPVSGLLPPLSESQWDREFEHYQQFPEFKVVNQDMTLSGFKKIFWIEYIHRLAGRIVAAVFLFPFLYFLVRGYLRVSLAVRFSVVFLLGGLQGVLGWYMVKSGLVDDPSVSQYRLTAHLSLAVVLYGYVLWLAVGSLGWSMTKSTMPNLSRIRLLVLLCIFLVALMQISGGLMAGTHAGFVINTYPHMNGQWIPDMLLSMSPLWRNLFENVVAIQFVHRWLAVAAVSLILLLWIHRFLIEPSKLRLTIDLVLTAALVQFLLGISTLLSQVKVELALFHQAGFVLLISLLIVLFRIVTPVAQCRAQSASKQTA